ncbi:homoserine dehydrogenase [Halothermothrix orenii]|uniref:Homoserine dehydrogenase n=1 Tax=Halothermothrix orenii (strain H 168 / OCM 544 / DSM 9562) TaxID=373903 RepID=B8CW90_HALOH|nr:homoserine dehydrogenase [Halothermothrix orenii]ACL69559.1 Homoserine dehydrogenase [Halothermothrix orenii H 168]
MIKIGLLGLGTVGSGVVTIMENNKESIRRKVGTSLAIEKVLVKNLDKERDLDIDSRVLTSNIEDIVYNPDIDLVVELIGGEEPACQYIKEAINRGKSVVTANKLVIAKHGTEILKLAREKGVQVSYEGSVGGGIPIIRPLKESLAANRIHEIYGILNGTTNYILTKMTREGRKFQEVLAEAQKLGYAESDPSSDIEGYDAAYKIAILASIAFETSIDISSVYVEGIDGISVDDIELARELGYVIKLLAIGKRCERGLDIRVHPTFIPRSHPLALVSDVYNAVYLHGDAVGDVMSYGKGAGQMPTGSAVVADIIQVARDIHSGRVVTPSLDTTIKHRVVDINEIENSFYLRLQVRDKPGVLAQITKVLGDNKVSLASVLQKHRLTTVVPLVLITHPVKEQFINKSLKELKKIEDVVSIDSLIRVEEESI